MQRLCIYAKDIEILTGRGSRYARDVIQDIKVLHKKEKHQLVTIREASDYLGLPYEDVIKVLNNY
ncbi:hypothetical protein [Mangrovimonas aestuarii]|uniref:hypothetical protein n=1 Tax=Mangrovimonas aestuarii TaxID=3018443 RepID=UPI002379D0D5|nr:hypothetical protein [Mangrovimonas aestuarii]